jgi:hypothetical protein
MVPRFTAHGKPRKAVGLNSGTIQILCAGVSHLPFALWEIGCGTPQRRGRLVVAHTSAASLGARSEVKDAKAMEYSASR